MNWKRGRFCYILISLLYLAVDGGNASDEQGKNYEEIKAGLLVRLELAENKANEAEKSKTYLIQMDDNEGAADAEEEYHAASLEISQLKKQLKQIENNISNASQQRKAKETVKLSRECKAPLDKPPPPVDATSFNDDGECVPEGIISHRLKVIKFIYHNTTFTFIIIGELTVKRSFNFLALFMNLRYAILVFHTVSVSVIIAKFRFWYWAD